MQEYKITGDELKELNNLINRGYKIYEINTYRGLAEIKLEPPNKNDIHIETIIMEAI